MRAGDGACAGRVLRPCVPWSSIALGLLGFAIRSSCSDLQRRGTTEPSPAAPDRPSEAEEPFALRARRRSPTCRASTSGRRARRHGLLHRTLPLPVGRLLADGVLDVVHRVADLLAGLAHLAAGLVLATLLLLLLVAAQRRRRPPLSLPLVSWAFPDSVIVFPLVGDPGVLPPGHTRKRRGFRLRPHRGKRMTSRMVAVGEQHHQPVDAEAEAPVGGMPCSRAARNSSSMGWASSSPASVGGGHREALALVVGVVELGERVADLHAPANASARSTGRRGGAWRTARLGRIVVEDRRLDQRGLEGLREQATR